jgi:hypothetical protein
MQAPTRSRTSYLVIFESGFLSIVAPVLERLVRFTVGVLFGFLLLGEMAFVICSDFTHMGQVILVVLRGVLLWILLQDLNYLAATDAVNSEAHVQWASFTFHDQRSHQTGCHGSSPTLWNHLLLAILPVPSPSC